MEGKKEEEEWKNGSGGEQGDKIKIKNREEMGEPTKRQEVE